MIIKDHFGGVYTGENVEKEARQYLNALRDYNNGKYYESERVAFQKTQVPKGYNIDPRPHNRDFARLPKSERDKIIAFWKRENRRCIEGVGPVCGLQYGYANYCRLRGGKGDTQYRRWDNFYFKIIEERMWGDKRGTGIIEIGRRRSGKSSKIMYFTVHCIRTMRDIDIAVTSKTEKDAQRVLINEKAQFIYQHLPLPLKPSQLKTNQGELHLGKREKDDAGNYMVSGLNSKVFGLSPKPEAVEGSTLQVWIHDEMGKTRGLLELFRMTVPALADMNGLDREGLVLLTGVAGDRGKFEDDLILWKSADSENLTRLFSPGWVGLELDEFGEENVERAVRKILNKRNEIINAKDKTINEREIELASWQQQYPLTLDEAFMSTGGGKWNNVKINRQITYLNECPAELFRGDAVWTIPKAQTQWIPHDHGKTLILEHPQPGAKYVSGIDCYGLKQQDAGSEGCQWIMKLENTKLNPMQVDQLVYDLGDPELLPEKKLEIMLKLGHLPVAVYVDAPKDPTEFADKTAALANYYSKYQRDPVKVLPETEPPLVLDRYMKEYKNMLMKAPLPSNKKLTRADFMKYGVAMKAYWTEIKFKMIAHYIENYVDRIFFIELLKKFQTYDETIKNKKYDEVDGLGCTLICAADRRILEWNAHTKPEEDQESGLLIPFKRLN